MQPAPATHLRTSRPTAPPPGLASRLLALPLLLAVRAYQFTLSPLLGGQCRYRPTCSHYAVEALRTYGGFRGGWMAAARLLRCHPFSRGGYDPVPPPE